MNHLFIWILFFILTCNKSWAQTADTIYYDKDWKRTRQMDSANYYRIAEKMGGDSFVVNDYYKSGKIQMTGTLIKNSDTGDKCGLFVYYSEKGYKESEGNYVANKREGLWKDYDSTGFLYNTIEYRNGKWDGILKMYYKNGQLKRKEVYKVGGFLRGECFAENGDEIEFYAYQTSPEFPGGEDVMLKFLAKNVKYPSKALENGISGMVIVTFFVDIDGSIVDIRMRKSLSPEIDAETIRVVKSMPKWKPATLEKIPIKASFDIPLTFSMK